MDEALHQEALFDEVLRVESLSTHFFSTLGAVEAVDDISFSITKGEVFGLVGESGCGKSTVARSVMKIIPSPGKVVGGRIIFDGKDITNHDYEHMRRLRGARMSMIFQDPMTTLNPVYKVRDQISEVIKNHRPDMDRNEVENRVVELLNLVRIPDAERLNAYPHELSGGMKQRVIIATAIALNPDLIIADEPTTALDVTIQAQVLTILKGIQRQFGSSILLITHDLGVVAEMCDQVAVMYAGTIVEMGTVEAIYLEPRHPYSQGLFRSVPRADKDQDWLEEVPGLVPSLVNPPKGCRFYSRCPYGEDICVDERPLLEDVGEDHKAACHRLESIKGRGEGGGGREGE